MLRTGPIAVPARLTGTLAVALLASACGSSGTVATPPVTTVGPLATAATAPTAQGLERSFIDVVNRVGRSVVLIETGSGLGSGIVLDTSGRIVTNAHVVADARQFRVTLASGARRSAKLVASFPPDDLAVIDATGSGFRPATFGDSSKLHVGSIVLAMGNPLGLQSSVTQGIVSALGRTVSEENGAALPNTIQTSASINPGNSGGALVNLQGQVVGMPTLAAADPQLGSTAAGIGFAIPSNRIRDIAGQIVEHGKVLDSHRAYLGVQLADTGGAGALVGALVRGGPAAVAGIAAGD